MWSCTCFMMAVVPCRMYAVSMQAFSWWLRLEDDLGMFDGEPWTSPSHLQGYVREHDAIIGCKMRAAQPWLRSGPAGPYTC